MTKIKTDYEKSYKEMTREDKLEKRKMWNEILEKVLTDAMEIGFYKKVEKEYDFFNNKGKLFEFWVMRKNKGVMNYNDLIHRIKEERDKFENMIIKAIK